MSFIIQIHDIKLCSPLCEMCPNTEFFLARSFLHSDWIRRDTSYLSVFSPNAGKYGAEKTPYLDTFHAMHMSLNINHFTQIIYKYHKNLWNICMIKNRFPLNWLWVYYTLPFRQYDLKRQVSTLHLSFCFIRELLILMTL